MPQSGVRRSGGPQASARSPAIRSPSIGRPDENAAGVAVTPALIPLRKSRLTLSSTSAERRSDS